MKKGQKKPKSIFLVGGGTGGPTAPLLAVAEELIKREPKTLLFFVGSNRGPESMLLSSEKIKIKHLTIPSGKFRRYFSLLNLVDPLKIFFGFFKALYLLNKYKPHVVFGAGSYVQVPVVWASFFMRIPSLVHQQDVSPLLSTRLVAPVVKKITVAFKSTTKSFPQSSGLLKQKEKNKVVWVGNPVRRSLYLGSKKEAVRIFELNEKHPTVLVMGGGQGSTKINEILEEGLPELVKYVQVIHITGKLNNNSKFKHEHYHPYEFLTDSLSHAYAIADLVVSRAGMSSIGEIAALGKASILIPLPGSIQEQNAALLSYLRCAVPITEEMITSEMLIKFIRKILWDDEIQKTMHKNSKKLLPNDADKKLVDILQKVIKNNEKR